jgi:3-dehydroquinate dehydratase-2
LAHQTGFEAVTYLRGFDEIETPVIEVHISNTFKREEYRHHSYISPAAKGIIIGFGLKSYDLALQSFVEDGGAQRS